MRIFKIGILRYIFRKLLPGAIRGNKTQEKSDGYWFKYIILVRLKQTENYHF